MEERLAAQTAAEWLEVLEAAGVPAARSAPSQTPSGRQPRAGVAATTRVPHPTAGEVELMNSPIQIESGLRPPHAPPLLGEHTQEVLKELGLDDREIERLAAAGAVQLGTRN